MTPEQQARLADTARELDKERGLRCRVEHDADHASPLSQYRSCEKCFWTLEQWEQYGCEQAKAVKTD